jgi:hypothetical protein
MREMRNRDKPRRSPPDPRANRAPYFLGLIAFLVGYAWAGPLVGLGVGAAVFGVALFWTVSRRR